MVNNTETVKRTSIIEQAEHNDCAVRALYHATGITYETIWKLFLVHGRKMRKGTPTFIIRRIFESLNVESVPSFAYERLNDFAVKFNRGTFYIVTRTHCTVLKDGKFIELWEQPNARILCAWRVK